MNKTSHERPMDKYMIKLVAVVAIAFFWSAESFLHRFIFDYNEFTLWPTDSNELWMRLLVVTIIILFGGFIEYHMRRVGEKEKEKRDVYVAMLHSSNHILNNFLNQMQLMRIEASQCQGFDRDVLDAYDRIVVEAGELIHNLQTVPSLTKESILASVSPR